MDVRERVRARLNRRNWPSLAVVGGGILLGALNGMNTMFDASEHAQEIKHWDWAQLATLAAHPLAPIVLVALGVGWLVVFGEPGSKRGKDWVTLYGVRWRWRDTVFGNSKLQPYPHCPKHNVPLLWEAYDKSRASWQKHEVEDGMWFGAEHNGLLFCPANGGHEFHSEKPWMAQQAALEASHMLQAG